MRFGARLGIDRPNRTAILKSVAICSLLFNSVLVEVISFRPLEKKKVLVGDS